MLNYVASIPTLRARGATPAPAVTVDQTSQIDYDYGPYTRITEQGEKSTLEKRDAKPAADVTVDQTSQIDYDYGPYTRLTEGDERE
jgi:hypothetical protein